MKKKELLELLNKEPDSISLHDSLLCRMAWINNIITFTIVIGEYTYLINDLEDYIDDMKNDVVLSLQFCGVDDIECSFTSDFRLGFSDILDNNLNDGVFEICLHNIGSSGKMTFKYQSFAWDVIGEFSDEAFEQWCEENGLKEEVYGEDDD